MKQNRYYCKYIIYFFNYQRKYIKLFNLFGIMSFYVYFCRKIKYMDTEKVINDWCELINQDAEKRNNMWGLYKDFKMRIEESNTSNPIIEQEENGELSIKLVLDYWIEDEIQNLKNYGKVTGTT